MGLTERCWRWRSVKRCSSALAAAATFTEELGVRSGPSTAKEFQRRAMEEGSCRFNRGLEKKQKRGSSSRWGKWGRGGDLGPYSRGRRGGLEEGASTWRARRVQAVSGAANGARCDIRVAEQGSWVADRWAQLPHSVP
jgi:hypothetical protein